jgi:flagellar basal-body rod protein FlgF
MDRLIYTAMTGASATMGQEAAVAHNLANATSTGFKAELHRLRAVPVQNALMPTRAFVVDASVQDDLSTGPLQHTNRPSTWRCRARAGLRCRCPTAPRATPATATSRSAPTASCRPAAACRCWAAAARSPCPRRRGGDRRRRHRVHRARTGARNSTSAVDQLKLVNPPEADLARPRRLLPPRRRRRRPGRPGRQVAAGYLEGSNVNVVEQMVSMISLARQYEMQTKMLSTAQEMDRSAGQLVAKG